VDSVLAAVNARRPRPVDNQNKNLERYRLPMQFGAVCYTPTPKSYVKSWGSVEFFSVERGPDMGCGWVMRGQDLRGGMGMISIRI